MIVESPVHGVEEEQFADTVDRFAVVDGVLVILVHSGVQPVLVLLLVFPPSEGVLSNNFTITYSELH